MCPTHGAMVSGTGDSPTHYCVRIEAQK